MLRRRPPSAPVLLLLLATVLGLAGAGYLSKACARFSTNPVAETGVYDDTQPGGGLTADQALVRDTLRDPPPQSTAASGDAMRPAPAPGVPGPPPPLLPPASSSGKRTVRS